MFALFAAISLQKAVRDQLEGIPVTNLYYGLAWFSTILTLVLLTVGLWNAGLSKSEKGFYAMSFVLSVFSAIAVQKNTRDAKAADQKMNPGKHRRNRKGLFSLACRLCPLCWHWTLQRDLKGFSS